jgi:hypothetical protein
MDDTTACSEGKELIGGFTCRGLYPLLMNSSCMILTLAVPPFPMNSVAREKLTLMNKMVFEQNSFTRNFR